MPLSQGAHIPTAFNRPTNTSNLHVSNVSKVGSRPRGDVLIKNGAFKEITCILQINHIPIVNAWVIELAVSKSRLKVAEI